MLCMAIWWFYTSFGLLKDWTWRFESQIIFKDYTNKKGDKLNVVKSLSSTCAKNTLSLCLCKGYSLF